MYQFGVKLTEMACGGNHEAVDFGNTLSLISKCFLAALSSLSLVDIADQFVLVPIHGSQIMQKVDIATIRKHYHLILSKLILYKDVEQFQHDFSIPDGQVVYELFCDKALYSNGLQIALLLDLKLDYLFDSLCKMIVHFSKSYHFA